MIDERKLILSVKSGSEKAYRTLYEIGYQGYINLYINM